MVNWETILETDNFIVDYDKSQAKYRVSYFEDNHFVDECKFDAPIVHGEWIPIVNHFHGKPDGRYYCSVCHRVETTKGIYCRICGTRMDGGN